MATIMQIANADRNLSLFARGLKLSGLDEQLDGSGPYTMIGVSNTALENLIAPTYEELLQPNNKQKLADFLAEYIVQGESMLSDFKNDPKFETLGGATLGIITINGEIFINGARLIPRDWQGTNGVVHVLDNTYAVHSRTDCEPMHINFLKQHLISSHYSWLEDGKKNVFVGRPSRRTFNRYNGDQVLFMINCYFSMLDRYSINEGKKVENELLNHLPLEMQSEISVFQWLQSQTRTATS